MSFISDSEFLVCLKNLPIPAVDILLFNHNKDKVLLLKRINEPAKGKFFTPGGRINKGETILEAASRKMYEELGLKTDSSRFIFGGVVEEKYNNGIFGNIDTHYIDLVYGLILDYDFEEEKIKLDAQHSEYKWFKIDNPNLHIYVKNKISTIIDKIR